MIVRSASNTSPSLVSCASEGLMVLLLDLGLDVDLVLTNKTQRLFEDMDTMAGIVAYR